MIEIGDWLRGLGLERYEASIKEGKAKDPTAATWLVVERASGTPNLENRVRRLAGKHGKKFRTERNSSS
jgi:hypothetical protein